MGFLGRLFGKGFKGSNSSNKKSDLTLRYINFLNTTSNFKLFFQVFSALENYFINYHNNYPEKFSFSDLSEDEKEEKFAEVLHSFVNEKFHGNYINDLHRSLNILTPKEAYAEDYNLWHAEKSLEMLKFQLEFGWTTYENIKNGNSEFGDYPFDKKNGPFKNSMISTENLELFYIKYNALKTRLKDIKEHFGLPNIDYKAEWPFFFKETEPRTYNWKLGAIPIIPKYKHMPLGHLSGFLINDYSSEGMNIKFLLNQLKDELNHFPDYKFLINHGGDYGFYSIFEPPTNSTLLDDYQKLISFDLSLLDLEKSSFFIENMSLDQIKEIASEIKKKINEQRRIEEEESFRLMQQKATEAEEKRKFEKWVNIKDLAKHEITDEYNEPLAGIYVIHCESNNGVYIGSTENFQKRRLHHLYGLRKLSHHSYKLQDSFNTYGEENLRFYALETIKLDDNSHKNKRKLKLIEQGYLDQYAPDLNIERDAFGKKHYYF